MTDNRKSGLALIAGSLGMIITMAVHPHGAVAAAQVESMARNLTIVHSLALASLVVLFLGAFGLSHRLKSADRFDTIGLALFAFASIAVMNAAVMDGLVAPNIMRRIVEAGASGGESWRVVFRYNFEVNQGFAALCGNFLGSDHFLVALYLAKSHTHPRFGDLWLCDWSRFGDRGRKRLRYGRSRFRSSGVGSGYLVRYGGSAIATRTRRVTRTGAVLTLVNRRGPCHRTIHRWASPPQLPA